MTLYDDVGSTLRRLLVNDPFYAMFMISLDKQETTKVPTLAVGLNGVNAVLYINPEFWFSLNKEEKFGVCKHEMMHLCFMHLVTASDYPDHKRDNIATDLEINQYIPNDQLPKDGVTLSRIRKEFGLELPEKKGRDYYYHKLAGKVKEDFVLGSAEHFWEVYEKLSEAEKAVVRNQIEYKIQEIHEELLKTNSDKIPGEISTLIKAIKKPPQFDWKKYLRQWTGNGQKVELKQTRFKPNPYFPANPSNKVKIKDKILLAIDTSGSVSDTELQEFLSEIHNLWKQGHTLDILCVDTAIHPAFEYNGEMEVKMLGRGGTYFTPTLEYFNEHREYSRMIYFTDGGAELPPNAIRPMLWVISSKGTDRYITEHNGKILKIINTNE